MRVRFRNSMGYFWIAWGLYFFFNHVAARAFLANRGFRFDGRRDEVFSFLKLLDLIKKRDQDFKWASIYFAGYCISIISFILGIAYGIYLAYLARDPYSF